MIDLMPIIAFLPGCDVGLLSNEFMKDLDKIWALREWIPDAKKFKKDA
jgi:hypothetical protein